MLLLKTKLMIVYTYLIFNDGQNAQLTNFRTSSVRSYWTIIVFVTSITCLVLNNRDNSGFHEFRWQISMGNKTIK